MAEGVAVRVNGAPNETATAATAVQVTEMVGQPTYFSLEYSFDTTDGDFPLLTEGALGPSSELSVIVSSADANECLAKGPVYGQQIHFSHGGSGSSLSVQGADSLIKLDRENKAVAWSDLTDSSAVSSILSQAGFTPDVETTQAGHLETKHTLVQRETDLSFIRRLARRNGFHFWITCDEFGVETAHFKRPALDGNPTCDLVINLTDPSTNVTSLDISWDAARWHSALSDRARVTRRARLRACRRQWRSPGAKRRNDYRSFVLPARHRLYDVEFAWQGHARAHAGQSSRR